jgi:threonine/homoserine/homoserine lactone efflux protein
MESQLLAFVGVAALLTISPGADMALVTRNAIADGRAAAQLTTLGISAGLVTWAVASAVGVAALLSASAAAFLVVKVAGAVYLVVLGTRTILRSVRGVSSDPAEATTGATGRSRPSSTRRGRSPFRQGLLTNLLNPKIAVFYTTVLPQFVSAGDPVLVMSVGLALIHVCLTLVWLSSYAFVLTRAGDVLRRPRARRAIDALTGTVLVGVGLRLAVAER